MKKNNGKDNNIINRIVIRKEEPDDYYQTELMTQRAFWNKYRPGCDEHYLVHKLRDDSSYLPGISRVAELDGKIIGCVMYTRAKVIDGDLEYQVVSFGPLCVDPDYQGCRIGEKLMRETLKLAAWEGIAGVIIYGEPDYYPRLGFKTCDHFGITTPDGENFDAFMCYELNPGSMEQIHGKFYVSDIHYQLPEAEVEEFNKRFPYMEAIKGGAEQCARLNLS